MKVYVADLLVRLGKIRSLCDGGQNNEAKIETERLSRDIVGMVEGISAPGIEGLEVAIEPETTPEEDTSETADVVTPPAGEPPMPANFTDPRDGPILGRTE